MLIRTLGIALALATALGASGCTGLRKDDDDPVLRKVGGNRASVSVEEQSFGRRGGGGSSIQTTTIDSDGNSKTQTTTVNIDFSGFHWTDEKAATLVAHFNRALLRSGGFVVIADSVRDIRSDTQLQKQGYAADSSSRMGQALMADLTLSCGIDLNRNAGGSRSRGGFGGWLGRIPYVGPWIAGFGWFGGSTRRAQCTVTVQAFDRRTRELVADAKGEGYSMGSSKSGAGVGFGGLFGGFGSGSVYENPDIEKAIARATVRAVNDLVDQIPSKYKTHDPK